MAFMEDDNGDDQLFGIARGENCGIVYHEKTIGACGIVWRVTLDNNGVPTTEYHSKKLITMREKENFIGMRS